MPTNLITKMVNIAKREGFQILLHKIITYPGRNHWLGLRWEARYFHEYDLRGKRNEEDFLPTISDFTLHIVHNNEEADELETNGYDFRSHQAKARLALDSGAIAFCIFVGKEFAHIGWIATNENAKPPIDDWTKVNFANREGCTGATITMPKYGGNGFMKYVYFKRLEYLRKLGMEKSRASIGMYNNVSLHVHAKFNPRRYALVRYMKIFGWSSWKEIPLDCTPRNNVA